MGRISGNLRRSDTAMQKAIEGLNNTIQQMIAAENAVGSHADSLEAGPKSTVFEKVF